MRGTAVAVIWAALTTLTMAGCSGNSTSPGQCNPPNGITTVLAYPPPNSTGIPDNFGVVVLASTSPLPSSFQAVVVNDSTQNSVAFNVLGLPPAPLPTPFAIPSFPHPSYQASGNPGASFVAGSTITIYLNDTGSNCNPSLDLGSFRVQ
jgi:hypothetical protein